jgi:hypothetical protein
MQQMHVAEVNGIRLSLRRYGRGSKRVRSSSSARASVHAVGDDLPQIENPQSVPLPFGLCSPRSEEHLFLVWIKKGLSHRRKFQNRRVITVSSNGLCARSYTATFRLGSPRRPFQNVRKLDAGRFAGDQAQGGS